MNLELNKIYQGNTFEILKQMPEESVDCIITSPPYYGLRDYGVSGQIGLEATLEIYLNKILAITKELKRVLKKTGTLWWNHGDSYGGGNGTNNNGSHGKVKQKMGVNNNNKRELLSDIPEKCLLLQNYRLIIRMIDEQQWILRNSIIWWKQNCMPASANDRFTNDYEPVFFLSKSTRYYFQQQLEDSIWARHDKRFIKGPTSGGKTTTGNYAIDKAGAYRKDGKRNMRSVWAINTKPYKDAHFATFPEELCEIPIKAGSPPNGIVLDPFSGSGTTAFVARQLGRQFIGIEINPDYIKLAEKRLAQQIML